MLKQTQKTNGGMPPQFHPLEVRGADTRKGKARNGLGHTAAFQPSREETTGSAKPVASPASAESGVSRVFVLDAKGNPLMPCHPARARRFLKSKRARVHKMFPFTIRLVDRTRGDTQPCRLKFDPGAKVTGIAIVRESGDAQHVLHLAEVEHRGNQIHRQIQQRSNYRRRRRSTNLRYRKPRFNNRTRPKGWLPPSLKSRVDNCLSWTSRYLSICPASALSLERVRFDTQKMENPELSGVEYQQGELSGYEVREYLLEKWGRKCAYCGAKNVPLEVEHIRPKSKGGSNRISNLTLSCKACNQAKGNMPIEDFLRNKPEKLKTLLAQAKKPLNGLAAVNASRNAIFFSLRGFGLPVESSTGGRTKFNRSKMGVPKTHSLDAACVGNFSRIEGWKQDVLKIKAMGRGSYQRTRVDKSGFPRGFLIRQKKIKGFQTGDIVKAIVPKGKKQGEHIGRVAVRATGSFNIQTTEGVVQGISYKYCHILQYSNGYNLSKERMAFPPSPEESGSPRHEI